jgi:hypothetical protein
MDLFDGVGPSANDRHVKSTFLSFSGKPSTGSAT